MLLHLHTYLIRLNYLLSKFVFSCAWERASPAGTFACVNRNRRVARRGRRLSTASGMARSRNRKLPAKKTQAAGAQGPTFLPPPLAPSTCCSCLSSPCWLHRTAFRERSSSVHHQVRSKCPAQQPLVIRWFPLVPVGFRWFPLVSVGLEGLLSLSLSSLVLVGLVDEILQFGPVLLPVLNG